MRYNNILIMIYYVDIVFIAGHLILDGGAIAVANALSVNKSFEELYLGTLYK